MARWGRTIAQRVAVKDGVRGGKVEGKREPEGPRVRRDRLARIRRAGR